MEKELDNTVDFKNRLLNFYKENKIKLIILFIFTLIILIFFSVLNLNNKKNNKLIAEKYVQAGIFLSLDKNENAKEMFEEIVLSKNQIYSILALNTIIEKELILDKAKILNFFEVLENSIKEKESKDLIVFKKALYLIKNSNRENGEKLLKALINNNSSLKTLAQEIIDE